MLQRILLIITGNNVSHMCDRLRLPYPEHLVILLISGLKSHWKSYDISTWIIITWFIPTLIFLSILDLRIIFSVSLIFRLRAVKRTQRLFTRVTEEARGDS